MCGIRTDGENHFTIAPKPGGNFTYARVGYNSIYGAVESGWEKTETGYRFRIVVPCNTTATVILPDGTVQNITTGEHCFHTTVKEVCL
jgi:alpha-L-rhamnosidase